jgi:hypothetical protein
MDAMNKLYSKSKEKYVELKKIFKLNEHKKNKKISVTLYIYLKTIHEDLDSIENQKREIKSLMKKYKSNKEKQDMFKQLNTKSINDINSN